jgi:hypothetical protein
MKDEHYGYVYCMTNKYMPNICKIGFINKINKTSFDRAKELSSNTSCPVKFDVEFDIKVKNPYKYEKRIHKKLNKFRINNNREFFRCLPQDVIKYFYQSELTQNKNNNDFANNYMTIYNNFYKDIKINNINNKNNIYYYKIFFMILSIFLLYIEIKN